jgi:phosphate/sulfate permease
MRAGHRPRIIVSSCLAGLFVRLTGLFVRLAGLFVSLAGIWVFGNKIYQTVGDEIFFSLHIILEVGKQRDL